MLLAGGMFLAGFLLCLILQIMVGSKVFRDATKYRKLQAGHTYSLTARNGPPDYEYSYWEFHVLKERNGLCQIRYDQCSLDIPSILLETHPQLEEKFHVH